MESCIQTFETQKKTAMCVLGYTQLLLTPLSEFDIATVHTTSVTRCKPSMFCYRD